MRHDRPCGSWCSRTCTTDSPTTTGSWRRRPEVDAVAIAGDLVDVVSPVPHEVQTVVRQRTTSAGCPSAPWCSRPRATTTSTDPGGHGEQVAAWLRNTGHDVARRRHLRRRRRHALHGVPVVGRSGDPRRGRRAARGSSRGPTRAMGVALPRTTGRYAVVLRRAPHLPRPRPGDLDRRAPARRGAVRTHPPVAVGGGRVLARPPGRDWVFNAGEADRQGAARTSRSTPRPGRPRGSGSSSQRPLALV